MIRLLVTSGRGPAECRLALARALDAMSREAGEAGLSLDILSGMAPDKHGPGSAIVLVAGESEDAFCRGWEGAVQWTARSPLRPHHARKNWFLAVVRLSTPLASKPLREADIRYETLKASGPGGQHVNKTESAVRATDLSSGMSVVARTERSQHRNKAEALARLSALVAQRGELERLQADKAAWLEHEKLVRGGNARHV